LDERSKEILLQDQYYSEQILPLKEYNLHFFEDLNECREYLCKKPTGAQMMFLVHEQWAEDIVHIVHNLCSVKFIFIIHPIETDINHQNNSSPQYLKVSLFKNLLFIDLTYRLFIYAGQTHSSLSIG
jgi:hypothetical protein